MSENDTDTEDMGQLLNRSDWKEVLKKKLEENKQKRSEEDNGERLDFNRVRVRFLDRHRIYDDNGNVNGFSLDYGVMVDGDPVGLLNATFALGDELIVEHLTSLSKMVHTRITGRYLRKLFNNANNNNGPQN